MKSDDPFTLDLTEYVTKGCFTAEGFKAFCEIALSINKEGFSLLEMGSWLERGRATYIQARTPKSVAEMEQVIKVLSKHLPPQTLKEVLERLNGETSFKSVKPTAEKFLDGCWKVGGDTGPNVWNV